ncbi:MAG: fructose-6-phosphate aldolase [Candidatus Taylorbacteria bacterium]|nr:fructose-6-phosphate aldolase [Candidatus Taylorbacteria bacterium]
MKLFIDTANLEEIKTAASWGVLDGVTTNPSWIARDGGGLTFKELILEICKIVDGPISAETVSLDAEGMIKEGKEIAKWHKNIYIKVVCTIEGLKAVKEFDRLGIKTNVTLVFAPSQVLVAAKAGATLISPFLGRLNKNGGDSHALIASAVQIIKNYNFASQILAASLHTPEMVVDAALAGAHIGTMPFTVMEALYKHPLTDKGIEKFLEDWTKAKK